MFSNSDTIGCMIISCIQFALCFAVGVNLLDAICIFFGVNLKEEAEPENNLCNDDLPNTGLYWADLNKRK